MISLLRLIVVICSSDNRIIGKSKPSKADRVHPVQSTVIRLVQENVLLCQIFKLNKAYLTVAQTGAFAILACHPLREHFI